MVLISPCRLSRSFSSAQYNSLHPQAYLNYPVTMGDTLVKVHDTLVKVNIAPGILIEMLIGQNWSGD